jgi:tetratricopeptide (TPR) repeat protein
MAGAGKIRIIENKWVDFSTARNQAIDVASCGWIIWIDADDRVNPDCWKEIIRLKKAARNQMIGFKILNMKNGIPFGSQWQQVRMFPNHPALRYEYPVHEQIVYAGAALGLARVDIDTVTIWHCGYDRAGVMEGKAQRNLELLKSIPADKMTISHAMAIANSYYHLKDYWQGVAVYEKLFRELVPDHNTFDAISSMPCLIADGYFNLGKYWEALKWIDKAQNSNIEAWYLRGRCYEILGIFPSAMSSYKMAITIKPRASCQPMNYDMCRLYSYHSLLRLYMVFGNQNKAVSLTAELALQYPNIRLDPGD